MLSREFPEHTLEEFRPDDFITYPAINFGTRYFTSQHDNPYTSIVPFSPGVDPKGILSSSKQTSTFMEKTTQSYTICYKARLHHSM
jgi:hypothetical protein